MSNTVAKMLASISGPSQGRFLSESQLERYVELLEWRVAKLLKEKDEALATLTAAQAENTRLVERLREKQDE